MFLHWCSVLHEGVVDFISSENFVFFVSAETACCAFNTAFPRLEATHRGALEKAIIRVLVAAAHVKALCAGGAKFPILLGESITHLDD